MVGVNQFNPDSGGTVASRPTGQKGDSRGEPVRTGSAFLSEAIALQSEGECKRDHLDREVREAGKKDRWGGVDSQEGSPAIVGGSA